MGILNKQDRQPDAFDVNRHLDPEAAEKRIDALNKEVERRKSVGVRVGSQLDKEPHVEKVADNLKRSRREFQLVNPMINPIKFVFKKEYEPILDQPLIDVFLLPSALSIADYAFFSNVKIHKSIDVADHKLYSKYSWNNSSEISQLKSVEIDPLSINILKNLINSLQNYNSFSWCPIETLVAIASDLALAWEGIYSISIWKIIYHSPNIGSYVVTGEGNKSHLPLISLSNHIISVDQDVFTFSKVNVGSNYSTKFDRKCEQYEVKKFLLKANCKLQNVEI